MLPALCFVDIKNKQSLVWALEECVVWKFWRSRVPLGGLQCCDYTTF